MEKTMSKERLVAFTDAVLAIIMTILILELQKPSQMTWQGIWDLRVNLFAYTLSFFWLGTMWVNLHRVWDNVKEINNKTVWISLLLLFFSSFFPYTTGLVAEHFNNPVAQTLYGIVVLLVSLSNVWMYDNLSKLENFEVTTTAQANNRLLQLDLVIKVVGLLLALTIYPPAMVWAVLITSLFIILPRSI